MRAAISNWFSRLALLALLLAPRPTMAAPAPTDYQVKAVFLFNFAQFVEWPSRAFADKSSPIVIGIVGEDPFGAVLDQVVKGEAVRGRPIVVRRYAAGETPDDCQILFISHSEAARVDTLLQGVNTRPVLTVSEND